MAAALSTSVIEAITGTRSANVYATLMIFLSKYINALVSDAKEHSERATVVIDASDFKSSQVKEIVAVLHKIQDVMTSTMTRDHSANDMSNAKFPAG